MFSFFRAQTNGMIFEVFSAVLQGIEVFWDLMMCPCVSVPIVSSSRRVKYSTVKALQSLDTASHPTRPESSVIYISRHSFHPVKSLKEV
jgi:hypothetical protein